MNGGGKRGGNEKEITKERNLEDESMDIIKTPKTNGAFLSNLHSQGETSSKTKNRTNNSQRTIFTTTTYLFVRFPDSGASMADEYCLMSRFFYP